MWGAGSGGSTYYTYDCFPYWERDGKCLLSEVSFTGGTAGAYIKANVATNRETINFTVGEGGNTCSFPNEYYYSPDMPYYTFHCEGGIVGTTTSINVGDSYLAAGVGNDIVTNITSGYLITTANGNVGQSGSEMPQNGGISVNSFNGKNNDIGQGSTCPEYYMQKGVDGGVVIYFNSVTTPSNTISISPTQSSPPSMSSLQSKSSTYSPTISQSPSISISLSSNSLQSTSETNSSKFFAEVVIAILVVAIILFCLLAIAIYPLTRFFKQNNNDIV